ncbi:hypothetical protein E2562_003194, partial [Oryza meyeriana var. granulata]
WQLYVQRMIDTIIQILPDKFQVVLTHKSRANGYKASVFSGPPISIISAAMVGGVYLSIDPGLAVGLSIHSMLQFWNKKVEDWTDPRFPTVQGILQVNNFT